MDKKELEELSMSNLDKVLRALDGGKIEEARKCVKTMEAEAKHAHDLMADFVWTLLSYIGKMYGDHEVIKALQFRHSCQPQVAERMLGMSPEDAVRFKTMIHRAHHSNITMTEEKDRYVMKLDPCNTGGRMLREGLDKPPINLGKLRKGFPESWNRSDVSYYCAHCGVHSIMSVEKGAPHPTWVYKCPENPQDPCYQYCYKRTEDVPEKYFEELGLEKGLTK
jgi:hypothetical protein